MNLTRDVVITGLGMVSPIGIGCEAFSAALRSRESGVRRVQQYDTSGRQVHIGGELQDFKPKLYVKPRKSLKVMSHEIQLGVAAAALATEHADLAADALDPERIGVVYGSPMMYADLDGLHDLYQSCVTDGQFDFPRMGEAFPSKMYPLWMLKFLPNMTASHIGIACGARGPNNSVVMGDMSSLLAIAEAVSVIQRGHADVMLTGGAGSRLSLTPTTYRGESNLSHRNDDPAAASRPFDADRDGMVIGEGACTLVLESREHAEARGATIYGRIVATAASHCGQAGTANMSPTIARSIQSCLDQAELAPNMIGHVNAHGSSERDHDAWEAKGIQQALGDVPVTASKSYFGNVGAAGGALELAASLLSIAEEKSVPATLNYTTPDAECPVQVVTDTLAVTEPHHMLKLSQSRRGQAAALLVAID